MYQVHIQSLEAEVNQLARLASTDLKECGEKDSMIEVLQATSDKASCSWEADQSTYMVTAAETHTLAKTDPYPENAILAISHELRANVAAKLRLANCPTWCLSDTTIQIIQTNPPAFSKAGVQVSPPPSSETSIQASPPAPPPHADRGSQTCTTCMTSTDVQTDLIATLHLGIPCFLPDGESGPHTHR